MTHPTTQFILEMVNCEGTNLIRLEPWLAGFNHVIQNRYKVSSGWWVGTCPFWVNWVTLNCQGKTIGHIKIPWSIFGLVVWFEFLGNIWLRLKLLNWILKKIWLLKLWLRPQLFWLMKETKIDVPDVSTYSMNSNFTQKKQLGIIIIFFNA